MPTPGEIRISHGKSITLEQARTLGLSPCIERMIHFTDHLRRLRVDQFEYAAMKVIILLSSGNTTLNRSSFLVKCLLTFILIRYEWSEGVGKCAKLSGIGAESASAVHALSLSGCPFQIRRAPPPYSRAGANLPGNSFHSKQIKGERDKSNCDFFCSLGRKGHAHCEKGRGWSGI